MNLLLSVFGGLLLTAVLFAAARALRLSVYWAAVIGAGTPTIAYVVHATRAWPGLDVVTLHVIAYPTLALLLFQMYAKRPERPGRMHWAPKLLVAFFVAITLLFAGFVHIASNGLPPALAAKLLPGADTQRVHTGFAGVVAHSPQAAKVIGHRRMMEHKLDRLGWHVEVSGLDRLSPEHEQLTRVDIRDPSGAPVGDVRVTLDLGRPGQAPVMTQPLREERPGSYQARLMLAGAGAWLARLTLEGGGERIELEHALGER